MRKQVFLSYNRKDTEIVRTIYQKLSPALLKHGDWHVWLDSEDLPPGQLWNTLAAEALKQSNAVVIFFGPHGEGAWQKVEIGLAQGLQVSDGIPMIPLLLPGAPVELELPGFLQNYTWVDFRDGLNSNAAWTKLIWGITEEKFSIRQLREFAAIAAQCPSMQDKSKRDVLYERLLTDAQQNIVRSNDDPEADLLALLSVALKKDPEIADFLTALRDQEPDANRTLAVENCAKRFEQANEVSIVLGDVAIDPHSLRSLYVRSAPDSQIAPAVSELEEMLEILADMVSKKNQNHRPIVEFVERIAQRLARADLIEWVNNNVAGPHLVALRDQLKSEKKSTEVSFLLIDIDSQRPDYLEYWLLDKQASCTLHGNQACHPSRDIRKALCEIIRDVGERVDTHLIIELLVPRKLFDIDVDQWRLPGNHQARIGEMYPVLLRWRDRAQGKRGTRPGPWQRIAKRIRVTSQSGTLLPTVWITRDQMEPAQLISSLSNRDDWTFVGCSFIPLDKQEGKVDQHLTAAIHSGVPYAFWVRQEPQDWPTLKERLDNVLLAGPFYGLPQRLRKVREGARSTSDPNHLGCALTLFWDDPQRNPLRAKFATIAQRGTS